MGGGVAALCAATACARDAEVERCPDLAPGDLVVTEVRGPQEGSDTYGQWFELYAATDGEVDLEGLHLEVRSVDGADAVDVIVRAPLVVAAGGYVVLGRVLTDDAPPHLDYDLDVDYPYDGTAFIVAGTVTARACDVVVDAVT